jgi:hypothetical protein
MAENAPRVMTFAERNDKGQLIHQADWHLARTYVIWALDVLSVIGTDADRTWGSSVKNLLADAHGLAKNRNNAHKYTRAQAVVTLRAYFPELANHAYIVNGATLREFIATMPEI